ncbi:MAG: FG-GAP-like repeat-containing protein [Verrucomicrobiia bacterium]
MNPQALKLVVLALCFSAAVPVLGQPRILQQPANGSVSLGATAPFSVRATTANPPLSYQWHYQDTLLPGATNATLILTSVGVSGAGTYRVAVSDLSGTTESEPALLDVDPTFTKITTDPLAAHQAFWHVGAVADYNSDGFPDVYLHECVDVASFGADYLYRNNGDGSFVRVTDPSLRVPDKGAMGPAWDDYDNDGTLDLFLPNGNPYNLDGNQQLRNRGDGTFESITALPAGERADSSGAAWGDFDRDGHLDLFVGNGSWPTVRRANSFYRNRGDGTFTRLTASQVGSWLNESQPWGPASSVDYDDDGWLDMMVTSQNPFNVRLYRNLGNGSFLRVTNNAICLENFPWMCPAWADFDNDGRLDLFGTMDGSRPNVLFHNEGMGNFRKMTAADVGEIVSDKAYGGASAWGDFDNDGFLDLFVPNGIWYLAHDGVQKSFLYRNKGDGTFTRIERGSLPNELGKPFGAHWVDFNRDGFLDLFVSEYHAAGCCPPIANCLYLNNGNANSWLAVTCIGTSSPRSGTGAKVRVRAVIRGQEGWQLRLINSGATSYGGQSPVAHFGLGEATNVVTLRIDWTSGIVQEIKNVPANQYFTVTEPLRLRMDQPGELHVQCWKGMVCRVDVSLDLTNWTPLTTVTNLTGQLQWQDPAAPSTATRFYRAVLQHDQ